MVPHAAWAQRASENVATQSADAFGRSVGQDKSGLYSSDDVRGFNPVDAGNVRIEGLYFDQVDRLSTRLSDGNTIRVGPAALRYPFPAPTGLVDYSLTQPRGATSYSFNLEDGGTSAEGIGGSIEFKQPLGGKQLGLSGGFGWRNATRWEGGTAKYRTVGATLGWHPREDVSVLVFGGAFYFQSDEARPTYYPAATTPPPALERGIDLSQPWTAREAVNWAYGTVIKAPLSGVQLEAGLFYNGRTQDKVFADLLFGVGQDGSVASRRVIADGDNRDASLSGEARLIKQWQHGDTNHRLIVSLRGRSRDRRFGGSRALALGPSTILAADVRAEPVYALGPKSLDRVRQLTWGASYSLVRAGHFGFDASLAKTGYRKAIDFADPLLADPVTRDGPVMWNVAGTVNLGRPLALYAGISHGMEEALVAPDVASNRSEAPPAIHTRQVEAGIKLAVTPHLTLIAGGFSITKPYYNLDPALRYRQLGTLRNRGVELSLTGQLMPGLTVVGGTMLLDPRISGEAVDNRQIGPRPVGQIRRRSVLTLDWRSTAGKGPLSLDVSLESLSSRTGNSVNSLSAPPRTVINLGARYRFKAAGADWLLRPVLLNALDEYGWNVSPSGGFTYIPPRALTLQLVADF
ncbi:MAG: TonB-dependent receptor domain-containing protein [Novosphingobium sp.]